MKDSEKKTRLIHKPWFWVLTSCLVLVLLLTFSAPLFIEPTNYSNEIFSPDGKYKVQASDHYSSSSTGFITNVVLKESGSILANSGDIFDFTRGTIHQVEANWIDRNTLKITYGDCIQVKNQENSWQNIKITYEKKSC